MAKTKGKSFGEAKGNDREKSWDADLGVTDIKNDFPDKSIQIRIVGSIYPFLVHWIKTDVEDLGQQKGKSFPKWCPDFDSASETSSGKTCDVCKKFSSKELLGRGQKIWYLNAFIEKPSKKKKGKATWTEEPEPLRLPSSVINEIKNIIEGPGNGVEPQDEKKGYTLWVKYDPNKQGTEAWSVQKGDKLPLSSLPKFKEKSLIDFAEVFQPDSASSIKESLERIGYYGLLEEDGKKGKKSSKKDSDFDDDDDDDEEDKKSKKKGKKSKKDGDDDEDDDDSDDDAEEDSDDDDDEDSDDDDDEDSDDDDEDDDDDDDEDSDDDEEDSDEDDDDDDDDDKKSKKKDKKGKKSKKDDDDEDDDEDDDSDDEDEEEDKKSKKKDKKSKKDKKYDFEDEDDDEEDKKSKKKDKKKKKK